MKQETEPSKKTIIVRLIRQIHTQVDEIRYLRNKIKELEDASNK